jgi:hypothetical protein
MDKHRYAEKANQREKDSTVGQQCEQRCRSRIIYTLQNVRRFGQNQMRCVELEEVMYDKMMKRFKFLNKKLG